jgi:hypothetical protein
MSLDNSVLIGQSLRLGAKAPLDAKTFIAIGQTYETLPDFLTAMQDKGYPGMRFIDGATIESEPRLMKLEWDTGNSEYIAVYDDSSKLYSGNGTPDPALGNEDDHYLDTVSLKLYWKSTSSGTWSEKVNFKSSFYIEADCAINVNVDVNAAPEATISGVSISEGSVCMLLRQTDRAENGLWVAGSTNWERHSEFNSASEILKTSVYIKGGSFNANKIYRLGEFSGGATKPVIGTSALWFFSDDFVSNGALQLTEDYESPGTNDTYGDLEVENDLSGNKTYKFKVKGTLLPVLMSF